MLSTLNGSLKRVATNARTHNFFGNAALACSLQRAERRAVFNSAKPVSGEVKFDCRGRKNLLKSPSTLQCAFARPFSSDAKKEGDDSKQDSQDQKNAEADKASGNGAEAKVEVIDFAAKIAELESQLKTKTELAAKLTDENKELKNRCIVESLDQEGNRIA
jgi:hypothetical protein